MHPTDKKEKLKKILRGEISAAEAFKPVTVTMYSEIKPGVYQADNSTQQYTHDELRDLHYNKPNEFIVMVRKFHDDGTPTPQLAHSENDIII